MTSTLPGGGPELAQRPVRLSVFNQLSRDEAFDLVRPCLEVSRWQTMVVDGRPYAEEESLLEVARDAAHPLTPEELQTALTHHVTTRPVRWLPHPHSLPPGKARRLALELDQYQIQFGHPFVIRTAGRSSAIIAAQLHDRLTNDVDTEDQVTATQLRQIALLTLTRQIRI